MRTPHPILVGTIATLALSAALVLTVRAMIVRDEPAHVSDAPVTNTPSSLSANEPAAVIPLPVAPASHTAVDASEPVAPVEARPVAPAMVAVAPVAEPVVAAPAITEAPPAVTVTESADAGPPEALDTIRPDIARARASAEALSRRLADAGAARAELLRAALALSEGPSIVRRLSAGDPAFAEQLRRYREALRTGGALDPAARDALRARTFEGRYLERAQAYDEVVQLLR